MKLLSFYKILAGGLLIAISALVSCKKLIEVPSNPPTLITRQEQFTDSATAMSAVAGVYSYTLGSGGIPYSDGMLTISTSLSANEISNSTGGDETEFSGYSLTPLNGEVGSLWGNPYQSVYQVNDVLAGISNNKNLSASF